MSRSYTLAVLRWLWINVIIRFDPHTYNREGSLTCTPLYITVWSSPPSWADQQAGGVVWINRTDLGTMSLKSSILSLPAGVSPMLISINTTGRGLEVMAGQKEVVVTVRRAARQRHFRTTNPHNHVLFPSSPPFRLARRRSDQIRGRSNRRLTLRAWLG